MLKRLLLAGCCATPLVWAAPAHAQLGALLGGGGGGGGIVTCTNCTEEVTAVANDILIAAQWVTQLERMTQQIIQQTNIFNSVSGVTNVNGMAAILNQAGNFNPMGNNFGNVPGQLGGAGGGIGAAYQAYNGNALPVGSAMPLMNTTSAIFNARAGSLASVQGMSASLLATSNVILTGLRTLQTEIDAQPSAQKMLGINSRLSAYQGNINSQQYQLSQMKAFADAQDKVFDQKVQQAVFCSASGWAADNPSLSGAGLNLGAAHCVGAAGGAIGGVPVAGGGTVLAGAVLPATGGLGTGGFDTAPATSFTTATPGTATGGGGDPNAALPEPPIPPGVTNPTFADPNSGINVNNVSGIGEDPATASPTPPAPTAFNAAPVPDGEGGAQAPIAVPAPAPEAPAAPQQTVPFDPTTITDDNGDLS